MRKKDCDRWTKNDEKYSHRNACRHAEAMYAKFKTIFNFFPWRQNSINETERNPQHFTALEGLMKLHINAVFHITTHCT